MLSQLRTTVEQVPVQAWVTLLALTTLAFGYRIALKWGPPPPHPPTTPHPHNPRPNHRHHRKRRLGHTPHDRTT
ncbi:hypothetical protein, partial [Streptomyces anulatus]|uniref:hypothetical protein n=1 Tax=Streptomyces anulatus TaxID=1892 RepID=UPI0036C1BEB4